MVYATQQNYDDSKMYRRRALAAMQDAEAAAVDARRLLGEIREQHQAWADDRARSRSRSRNHARSSHRNRSMNSDGGINTRGIRASAHRVGYNVMQDILDNMRDRR